MKIIITAGHGNVDSGSIGYDKGKEKDRTLELAKLVGTKLRSVGHIVAVMEEKTYNSNWNVRDREGFDVALSIHFNAFNGNATGTEVLYKNSVDKASELSKKVAATLGIKDRGAKRRTDLFMLNIGFDMLLETCFHDNKGDLEAYNNRKDEVATIIAEVINGGTIATKPASKSITELAKEVLEGKHGNGEERRKSLGDKYSEVQAEVNRLLGAKTTPTVNYYPKYTGTSGSIVEALKSIGVDSSYNNRKEIAKNNGIKGYKGTAAQNTKMLNLLKQGKLKK